MLRNFWFNRVIVFVMFGITGWISFQDNLWDSKPDDKNFFILILGAVATGLGLVTAWKMRPMWRQIVVSGMPSLGAAAGIFIATGDGFDTGIMIVLWVASLVYLANWSTDSTPT